MLPPFDIPEGAILLITDELQSPADFLLHRSLAMHLKETESKAIVISVLEDITRWKAIAAKSNINVSQHQASGRLQILFLSDILHGGEQPVGGGAGRGGLRALLDPTVAYLGDAGSETLVILEDISVLEWIGYSRLDISRFIRSLCAACLETKATLLIRHHVLDPGDPDGLFQQLIQNCTYHMEVRSLASGRSGSVSGEVALHCGMNYQSEGVKLIPRNAAIQYRLADNGPVFFERGTGGGVL